VKLKIFIIFITLLKVRTFDSASFFKYISHTMGVLLNLKSEIPLFYKTNRFELLEKSLH
jgi:hypothetical protein